MDREKIMVAVRSILEAIGEDPEREGLVDTPRRIADMYEEIFAGLTIDPAEYMKVGFEEHHKEMVVLRDIPFMSVCEHHLLPFVGKAHVGYIPAGRIVGLSKLARVVETYARRPQLQERLTSQVADTIIEELNPVGVGVVIEAQHFCMIMRGVKKPGSTMVTSAMRGLFRNNAPTRAEFLEFIKKQIMVQQRHNRIARPEWNLPVGQRTLVMGIINVTPNSFSGDGLGSDVESAVAQAHQMVSEGADLLDIGGQSTRPAAEPVSVEDELGRVIPVIERLRTGDAINVPISIDTNRSEVAEAALQAGADIVNDISGLRDDPAIADVAAHYGAGLVLMHIQGTPRTMQVNPHYENLLEEVITYLRIGIEKAETGRCPARTDLGRPRYRLRQDSGA